MPKAIKARKSSASPLRIVVSGGGTGGHMIPGIALMQEFQRLVEDVEVLFLTPGTLLERAILDEHEVPYECVGITKSQRGGIAGKAETALKLANATLQARKTLKAFRPDITFGVGGIQSMPGLMATRSLRRPIALLEQNRIMGKANRFMSRYAARIFAHLPVLGPEGKSRKLVVAGNPVRRTLGKHDTERARIELGLHPKRTTLLIMGGSQGAKAINELITKNFGLLNSTRESLQIIHLAGRKNFAEVEKAYQEAEIRHLLLPYGKEMGKLFAASDVVLCRSGATTISELTMLGKAMILVPLPSSKEGDQQYNATFVAERGGAKVVPQATFNDPRLLPRLLEKVILNESKRQTMADCASLIGKPRAGKDIALDVLKRLGVQVDRRKLESERRSNRNQQSGRAA